MTETLQDPTLIDGRFRRGLELGAGAFGSVYRAEQIVLDRPLRAVALKLFHGEAIKPDNVDRMMNDALQIQAILDQIVDWEIRQHFVTVYDLGVTRDALPRGFVAMELVRGGSLAGRIHDIRKFTLLGTLHYLSQIARALAYMHELGRVHSDLKPDNILVCRGRTSDLVKIGDFGLAGKYVGPYSDGPRGGTMSYMALEGLRGMATTPGCDVFSLGVMAYEMLTGENPYDRVGETLSRSDPDYIQRLTELQILSRDVPLRLKVEDFPELLQLQTNLPALPLLVDVINRMLQHDISKRYGSARHVDRALRTVCGLPSNDHANDTTSDTGPEPPPGDPLAAQILECECKLADSDWAAAEQAASSILKTAPQRAVGYQFKSRICQAQAKSSPAQKSVLLGQAIKVLERGVDKCPDPAERRDLNDAIATIWEDLGNYEASYKIRNRKP